MAAAQLQDIVADVNSIVAGFPFRFTQAKEPFSFELQPDTNLDMTFCLVGESSQSSPYFGYAQAQLDRLSLLVARKIRRDAQETVRMLYADVSSLTSALTRAGRTGVEYSAEVVAWSVKDPVTTDTHVVAGIDMLVDYDQSL